MRAGSSAPALAAALALALACGDGGAGANGDGSGTPGSEIGRSSDTAARPEGTASVPTRDAYVDRPLGAPVDTRAEVREAMGEPDSVRTRTVENRYVPGQTDTIAAMEYSDATLVFYLVTDGRELLSRAVVRADRWLRFERPGIGTPVDSLLAWFGEPDAREDGGLVYECRTCVAGPQPVTFRTAEGEIRSVEIERYVD